MDNQQFILSSSALAEPGPFIKPSVPNLNLNTKDTKPSVLSKMAPAEVGAGGSFLVSMPLLWI